MDEKVFRLPDDPDEIIRRLSSVNSESALVDKLYLLIAEAAGRELNYMGITIMLFSEIEGFITYGGYPYVLANAIYPMIPAFIDQLVDDAEIAQAAKDFYEQAVKASQTKQAS